MGSDVQRYIDGPRNDETIKKVQAMKGLQFLQTSIGTNGIYDLAICSIASSTAGDDRFDPTHLC